MIWNRHLHSIIKESEVALRLARHKNVAEPRHDALTIHNVVKQTPDNIFMGVWLFGFPVFDLGDLNCNVGICTCALAFCTLYVLSYLPCVSQEHLDKLFYSLLLLPLVELFFNVSPDHKRVVHISKICYGLRFFFVLLAVA